MTMNTMVSSLAIAVTIVACWLPAIYSRHTMETTFGAVTLVNGGYNFNENVINGPKVVIPNPTTKFKKKGTVTSISLLALRQGSFRVHIFHKSSDSSFTVKATGPTYYVSKAEIVNEAITLDLEGAYLTFTNGDNFALEFMDINPIPSRNVSSEGALVSSDTTDLRVGDVVSFSRYPVSLEYAFQLGVVYEDRIDHIKCEVIDVERGFQTITSPGYGNGNGNYPPYQDMCWQLIAKKGVYLEVKHFDLQSSAYSYDMCSDFVEVYQGPSITHGAMLSSCPWCGTNHENHIFINKNVTIYFHSDCCVETSGFKIKFRNVDSDPLDGGAIAGIVVGCSVGLFFGFCHLKKKCREKKAAKARAVAPAAAAPCRAPAAAAARPAPAAAAPRPAPAASAPRQAPAAASNNATPAPATSTSAEASNSATARATATTSTSHPGPITTEAIAPPSYEEAIRSGPHVQQPSEAQKAPPPLYRPTSPSVMPPVEPQQPQATAPAPSQDDLYQ